MAPEVGASISTVAALAAPKDCAAMRNCSRKEIAPRRRLRQRTGPGAATRLSGIAGRLLLFWTIWLSTACGAPPDGAEVDVAPISVAVAANFADSLRELAAIYEARSGQRLQISVGATGALCTQIEQGAPFELFLAADAAHPRRLESTGRIVAGSRHTYAIGELVLWSAEPGLVDSLQVLRSDRYQRLALANPETAPYGAAARQVLQRLGLWEARAARLVQGQSVGQVEQFIVSGAVDLGFVALAQVQRPETSTLGSWQRLPQELYDPLTHEGVLLRERPAAREFWHWLRHDTEARALIESRGYHTATELHAD